ncbi:MAG: grasp-with-spasm system ATP-grasp peptide maturase [Bacteroidales bacterium]|nr:grasp-with-spasm system ATP-grasp peptide maturase [Bacteroidales bacterium]
MLKLLILSEAGDRTTNEVAQWLLSWGVDFVRLNTEDAVRVLDVSPSSGRVAVQVRGRELNLADFDRMWLRRGVLRLECLAETMSALANIRAGRKLQGFVQNEWARLREYIFFCLERRAVLGSFARYNMNKLCVLHIAKECGLDIPETLISEDSSRIEALVAQKQLITKPISEAITYGDTPGGYFKLLTAPVDTTDLEQKDILPSLVQERLDKWVELRIFYLRKRCYTAAIFSQDNVATAVDFRNYSSTKNRVVPFSLPGHVAQKIELLMRKLNLDTGSIDMVLTRDMRYVFLEVNPVGNIEMVSKPCNYPIEREIAKVLSNGIETA